MSSSCTNISTLEQLPDEILLLICRYLSSVDILSSFYGLNSRLSKTISDHYRRVVLAQVPFKQFNYTCITILPIIGVNIRSLVVSNEWTGVLSKIFLSQFGERMSLVFPRLKHLILVAFITKSLTLFLDCLQNLTELSEITIHGLFSPPNGSNELPILLNRILSANNNRLNSIIFDYYSGDFCLDANSDNTVFSNIVKLHISLKNVMDLHQLLTILPQLCYLYTQIDFVPTELAENHQYNIVSTLKSFQLQSFRYKWSLKVLESILKRIPNVEELSIEIDGDDYGYLADGHQMFYLLSVLPLKKFNYFLRLYSLPSGNRTDILSSWQEFKQDFACIINEAEDILVLHTLPFIFQNLVLRCSLATDKIFSENYALQARFLHLYRVSTHISETFSTLQKCHRLRRLCLQIDEKNTSIAESFQQNYIWKLRYLTTVTISGRSLIKVENFQKLIEASPNLYSLVIDDEFIQALINDESISYILKNRITHLCISIFSAKALETIISSMPRLVSMFSSLKHLYIWLEKSYQSDESLIVAVLNYLRDWKCLISFATVGSIIKPEILTKGLRQWVIENSSLLDNDSFVADYFEERFRLWL